MSAEHTSGPWNVLWEQRGAIVTAKGDLYDVAIVRDIGNEDNKANALLIAAAPDLLAALLEADQDFATEGFNEDGPYRKPIRAAIAKATGGTQ